MRMLVSSKDIILKYSISYKQINYFTRTGIFKVARRIGNKRLYSLEQIEKAIQRLESK